MKPYNSLLSRKNGQDGFHRIGVATIATPRSRPKWALYLQRKNSEGPMAHPFGFVTIAKASGTQFGHSSNTVDTQLKQSSDTDGTQFRHSWDTDQTQLRHSSDTAHTQLGQRSDTVDTQFGHSSCHLRHNLNTVAAPFRRHSSDRVPKQLGHSSNTAQCIF